jgi:hypothetical protein
MDGMSHERTKRRKNKGEVGEYDAMRCETDMNGEPILFLLHFYQF